MKKRIVGLLALLFLIIPFKVEALSIGASSKQITNGNTVRVTVNASGLIGKFSVTSSNGNVLSGGTGSEWIENESKTYTFTSRGLGSATITVRAIDVSDTNGNKFTGSSSVTINVVKPREKSNNNNLKSLSVENYTLTPEFNKDTLEYNVEINDNAEHIKINGDKEDGYASVDGLGDKEVVEGLNKFEIKVTSETGNEKKYILNINVKDNNPINKKIDNNNYTVIKRIKSLVLPDALNKELFTETKVTIDSTEIPAYTSEEMKLTLVGLKDEKGNIYLYKYENNKIGDRYELLTSKSLTIIFENPKEELKGYTKTAVEINGKKYDVYQNKYKNYALIYGKNLETNESNWYLYNIKENSIQTYMQDMINDINKKNNDTLNTYKIIIVSLGIISLILLTLLLIKSKRKKQNHEEIKEEKIIALNNLVKEEKTEEIKGKKSKKKKETKKEEKENNSEFLNTKDLQEILETPKSNIEENEMSDEFVDKKKRKKGM